jgi:nicotinamide mononucleotide adenylyltransferase
MFQKEEKNLWLFSCLNKKTFFEKENKLCFKNFEDQALEEWNNSAETNNQEEQREEQEINIYNFVKSLNDFSKQDKLLEIRSFILNKEIDSNVEKEKKTITFLIKTLDKELKEKDNLTSSEKVLLDLNIYDLCLQSILNPSFFETLKKTYTTKIKGVFFDLVKDFASYFQEIKTFSLSDLDLCLQVFSKIILFKANFDFKFDDSKIEAVLKDLILKFNNLPDDLLEQNREDIIKKINETDFYLEEKIKKIKIKDYEIIKKTYLLKDLLKDLIFTYKEAKEYGDKALQIDKAKTFNELYDFLKTSSVFSFQKQALNKIKNLDLEKEEFLQVLDFLFFLEKENLNKLNAFENKIDEKVLFEYLSYFLDKISSCFVSSERIIETYQKIWQQIQILPRLKRETYQDFFLEKIESLPSSSQKDFLLFLFFKKTESLEKIESFLSEFSAKERVFLLKTLNYKKNAKLVEDLIEKNLETEKNIQKEDSLLFLKKLPENHFLVPRVFKKTVSSLQKQVLQEEEGIVLDFNEDFLSSKISKTKEQINNIMQGLTENQEKIKDLKKYLVKVVNELQKISDSLKLRETKKLEDSEILRINELKRAFSSIEKYFKERKQAEKEYFLNKEKEEKVLQKNTEEFNEFQTQIAKIKQHTKTLVDKILNFWEEVKKNIGKRQDLQKEFINVFNEFALDFNHRIYLLLNGDFSLALSNIL